MRNVKAVGVTAFGVATGDMTVGVMGGDCGGVTVTVGVGVGTHPHTRIKTQITSLLFGSILFFLKHFPE